MTVFVVHVGTYGDELGPGFLGGGAIGLGRSDDGFVPPRAKTLRYRKTWKQVSIGAEGRQDDTGHERYSILEFRVSQAQGVADHAEVRARSVLDLPVPE